MDFDLGVAHTPYQINQNENWKNNMQHFLQATWNCKFKGSADESKSDVWYLDDLIDCISDYDGIGWSACPDTPSGYRMTDYLGDGPSCWWWNTEDCTWVWDLEREDCEPYYDNPYSEDCAIFNNYTWWNNCENCYPTTP